MFREALAQLSADEIGRLHELEEQGLINRALFAKTPLEKWSPQIPTPKQRRFLDCAAFEALFGGAAGPGKSSALLMAALQHVDEPSYSALILRRTYADLALPGAIMDRSHEWLGGTGAHWNGTDKTWKFPSGARLTFGYLDTDKDKYRYQSSEFQFLAFDELTQFPESSYRYLLSRVRRGSASTVPLRIRCASNPGGIGHDWVYARFVDPATAGTRQFIPALLEDNPHIDVAEYRKSLSQLDETTRKQLEQGLWIKDTQGLVYKFSASRNLAQELPVGDWQHVLGIDFGSSQIDATTAFATWAFCKDYPATYLVECTKHAGLIVSTIADHVRALNERYHYARMVADQGALGKGYIEELRRRHGLPVNGAQKQDKLGYRKIFNGDLESRRVMILDGSTVQWVDEANSLIWNDDGTKSDGSSPDHATDAALYGWREARHYLYKAQQEQPSEGTDEYYRKQDAEYQRRIMAKIENRRNTENMLDGFV